MACASICSFSWTCLFPVQLCSRKVTARRILALIPSHKNCNIWRYCNNFVKHPFALYRTIKGWKVCWRHLSLIDILHVQAVRQRKLSNLTWAGRFLYGSSQYSLKSTGHKYQYSGSRLLWSLWDPRFLITTAGW